MSAGPNRRLLLAALLVASTVAFVIGVSIERSSDDGHDEPAAATVESSESGDEHAGEGREEAVSETEEEGKRESAAEADGNEDESVLGVDVEATPFVVLAAAVSLGLALAVWLRPDWGLMLGLVAAAMLAFAALDAREVVHQLDEDNGGLALLAAVVAALHLAAAAVALLIRRRQAEATRVAPV